MKALLEAPTEAPEAFAALAMAVPPAWHETVLRLAETTDRVEGLLKALPQTQESGTYAEKVRGLVKALVDLLDDLSPDSDLEPTFGYLPYGVASDECEPPEDDEESGDEHEPSLGSGAMGEFSNQERWALKGKGEVDAEDEHDGAEPDDNEGGEAVHEDHEPSLGWTVDGVISNTAEDRCDLEQGEPVRPPQDRTDLGTGVYAEPSYSRRILRGFTPEQREAFEEGMRNGNTDGVGVR